MLLLLLLLMVFCRLCVLSVLRKVLFLEEVAADPIGALSSVFDCLGLALLDEAKGKKVR